MTTMNEERAGFEAVYGTIKPEDHASGDDKAIYKLERLAFQAGAAWQRAQMGEWIPVSERLPADSRDVLVYCSDTDEHMVGSSMGCGRFAFAFSERGTLICCKPSHWRYIDEGDKPAAQSASTAQQGEGEKP